MMPELQLDAMAGLALPTGSPLFSMANTTRFMAELRTSEEVQRVAKEHGTTLTLEQAHECWCEHSDDYCAGWLAWRDTNAAVEILQSLTKYRERHPHVVNTGYDPRP